MSKSGSSARLSPGSFFSPRSLMSLDGSHLGIPDERLLIHLQLRRFAGCPVCNLHLRSFIQRQDEITTAGVREVVVFHSSTTDLKRYQADLPFAVIADPAKILYHEFGVESSPRAVLDPRAWWGMVAGILRTFGAVARRTRPAPPMHPEGGSLGLPADLLIAPDGRIVASKYGSHAYDQWSVDDVLEIARSASEVSGPEQRGNTIPL